MAELYPVSHVRDICSSSRAATIKIDNNILLQQYYASLHRTQTEIKHANYVCSPKEKGTMTIFANDAINNNNIY
jgi:hypothetical protein